MLEMRSRCERCAVSIDDEATAFICFFECTFCKKCAGAVSSYSWNDREIEFFHCTHCGCMTHYESIEKEDESRIAVNTRMLDAADVDQVPIKYFDGAVSWKYLDRYGQQK